MNRMKPDQKARVFRVNRCGGYGLACGKAYWMGARLWNKSERDEWYGFYVGFLAPILTLLSSRAGSWAVKVS